MKKRTTLKYYKGNDKRIRRVVRHRTMFTDEYRIKVFPIDAQGILDFSI